MRNCLTGNLGGTIPVSEFGDAVNHTYGYQYNGGSGSSFTTALDIDPSSTPGAYLQKVARGCAQK